MKKYFIWFLPFLISLSAHGQFVRNLSCENGLSNRRVLQILQDTTGYMWFATRGGIDRYDGSRVKNYTISQTATGRSIRMAVSSKGCLWAYTSSGEVSRYTPYRDAFEPYLSFSPSYVDGFYVFRVSTAGDNNLLFSTSKGLYCYDTSYRGGRVTAAFLGSAVYNALQLSDDQFCVSTDRGVFLCRWDPIFRTVRPFRCLPLGEASIRSIYYDVKEGTLWLGATKGDLFAYTLAEGKVEHVFLKGSFPILSITKDSLDRILAAVDGLGLVFLNRKLEIQSVMTDNEDEEYDLMSRNVYDVFCDRDGLLWISTYNKGVGICNPNAMMVKNYRHERNSSQSLVNDYVTAIVEHEGNLWFGHNKGMSLLQSGGNKDSNKRWRHLLEAQDGVENSIMAACVDKQGELWASNFNVGLMVLGCDGSVRRYTREKSNGLIVSKDINSLYCDCLGNVWISQQKENLVSYSPLSRTFSSVPLKAVTVMTDKDEKTLFAGTRNGLFRVDKETGAVRPLLDRSGRIPFADPFINTLLSDKEGHLWIGTEKGLYLYDILEEEYSLVQPLAGLSICGIEADSYSRLWISTHRGLYSYSPKLGTIARYGMADGVTISDFNPRSHRKLSNGHILFGSPNGVLEIVPETAPKRLCEGNLLLTSLSILGKPIDFEKKNLPIREPLNDSKEIRLSYQQNSFGIAVSTIDFIAPEEWVYSWKLEGADNDWTLPTDRREINYNNVSPGRYTLHIKAINQYNPDCFTQREIKVVIRPPFWRSTVAYLLYVLLLGAVVRMVYLYFKDRIQKHANEARIRLFVDTAHNIRTPITLIQAPLSELSHHEELSEDSQGLLKMAQRNVEQLSEQINQLLEFQRAEAYPNQLSQSPLNVVDYFARKCQRFEMLAQQKELTLRMDVEGTFPTLQMIDVQKLDAVTDNLLSNAVKYSRQGGDVLIKLFVGEGRWGFVVKDSGIGIPEEARKHLFRKFFRASNAEQSSEVGSGIGLLIAKRMVELMCGTIDYESRENQGTTFTVTFRMDSVTAKGLTPEESGEPDDVRPVVMVVEDNVELLHFLVSSLSNEYVVVSAFDGEEALAKLAETNADLILSDMMMPRLRGDELCRRLKEDIHYSHIPFVMLTALDQRKDIIEAYEKGADDYIVKPFDINILRVKIESILQNRRRLQESFAKSVVNGGVESVCFENDIDGDFIRKATGLVEQNLADSHFSIKELCVEIGMSRTSLYNKLKALTGLSPNDFIRLIRLNKAAELLKQGRYNVAEVAYRTGFSDARYFSTAFKKQYGVTPKQFH